MIKNIKIRVMSWFNFLLYFDMVIFAKHFRYFTIFPNVFT